MSGRSGLTWLSLGWWPWAGVIVLAFSFATVTRADPDLWGHVRFGLDILETHRLPVADPYSFTQDRPWLNHEWLSEVVMALAYSLGRSAGLSILKAALTITTFAVVWGALRKANRGVGVLALGWLAVSAAHMTSTLRPQLWSFLALAILCRLMLAPPRRPFVWMPMLFAVWANLHGAWFVGLGVFALWHAASGVTERRSLPWRAALVAACALATLTNPYGFELWRFVAGTVRFERDITEWRPLWEGASWAEWLPWLGTSAIVGLTAWRPGANRIGRLVVIGVLAFASLRVMRMGSLYALAALILLAPVLASRWPARLARLGVPRTVLEVALVILPSLLATAAALRVALPSISCVAVTGPWVPEAEPIAVLEGSTGRLVTYFDWGEYAIWHVGPGIQVSVDGRRETVYSTDHLSRHQAVVEGTDAGFETLAAWRPDYVWLPQTSSRTRSWLVDHGYRVVLESELSFLASLRPVAIDPGGERSKHLRCFPD